MHSRNVVSSLYMRAEATALDPSPGRMRRRCPSGLIEYRAVMGL
jgi:hypothetical protein